jgi:hypothetical protein
MEQKASPGRMVHFVPPQECTAERTLAFYPAIVTQVNGFGLPGLPAVETVELATFGPNSLYFQHAIPFSETLKPGHWSWPART